MQIYQPIINLPHRHSRHIVLYFSLHKNTKKKEFLVNNPPYVTLK